MTNVNPSKFTAKRKPNATGLLTEFLHSSILNAQKLRLDWHTINCCSWPGQAIEVQTGVNPYADFEGKTRSPIMAAKAIKEAGYNSLEDLITDRFVEIPKSHAWRGDICLVRADAIQSSLAPDLADSMPTALALFDPPFFWCVNPAGLSKGPISSVLRTFAIGHVDMREGL